MLTELKKEKSTNSALGGETKLRFIIIIIITTRAAIKKQVNRNLDPSNTVFWLFTETKVVQLLKC